ncbi:hypothetical protein BDQ17DRAFT_5689 [Cyathus striatus]|nr:hypothetical protein BDQ17DRAFT_5689 [Cyathus striatus]
MACLFIYLLYLLLGIYLSGIHAAAAINTLHTRISHYWGGDIDLLRYLIKLTNEKSCFVTCIFCTASVPYLNRGQSHGGIYCTWMNT